MCVQWIVTKSHIAHAFRKNEAVSICGMAIRPDKKGKNLNRCETCTRIMKGQR